MVARFVTDATSPGSWTCLPGPAGDHRMIRIWTTSVGFAIVFAVGAIGATNPPLPQGSGLAARYPRDAGIGSDAAVILADDFESYQSPSELTSKWNHASQGANVRLSTESGSFFDGSKALEFTIPQTTTETGPWL